MTLLLRFGLLKEPCSLSKINKKLKNHHPTLFRVLEGSGQGRGFIEGVEAPCGNVFVSTRDCLTQKGEERVRNLGGRSLWGVRDQGKEVSRGGGAP